MARVRNSRSLRPSVPAHGARIRAVRDGTPRASDGELRARTHVQKAPRPCPRNPRQERSTRTVEAIVGAASQLLIRQGYASTSTNAIARLAGVSVGSLYQYFRDKEDVFRAVVRRHRVEVTSVLTAMLAQMRAPDSDIVAVTLELLRRLSRVNGQNPRLLAAIERELGWLEHEDDGEAEVRDAVTVILQARFPGSDPPSDVIATLLVATVAPLSRWMVHSKPSALDTEQFLAAFGRMLRGLIGSR